MKTQLYVYLPFVFTCMLATLMPTYGDDKVEARVTASIAYPSEDIPLSDAQLAIPATIEESSYRLTVTSTPGVIWEAKTAEKGNSVIVTSQGV